MTDPIADMLTRIRNASAIGKPEVVLPMSKIKFAIAKILEQNHWVEKVEKVESIVGQDFKIVLKYEAGRPAITSLTRISKPSRRVYADKYNLPRVLNNYGVAIISTSQGLMTNKEAGKKGMGGEVICEIY
ncbi:30S ribosomal protein S8 [Candidatus Falkowbacteria bacterium CG10_big_fil_rev_8_21_14_0_10_37_14]|uniref:Small ribosomal subunit protein uS8 n=1 Tax=Candidatus Falkowbacteria bacterium CG10_big_fil_rev_8_21_14_0_10_37_14 TaxID=1974561 RepID=A0A2M6WTW4_9BACT|nr:30S ribosomal protein S8 [Candidatus Falkowbacteria bacterium]PIT96234.1 MAG: 30S ribosomal protein S8 [Candidatus Falkowbacteria bacterium CG10_big_fil_rev_8_21_14_0_10_37_14]